MNVDVPADYSAIVERLILEGRFRNAEEVVAEGLRLISMREELHAEIQAGLDDLDAGHRIEASVVYAEAKQRIQAIEDQKTK